MKEIPLHFFHTIAKEKIENNRSIIELTTYGHISLWWIIESILYNWINKRIKRSDSSIKRTNKNPLRQLLKTNLSLYFEFLFDLLMMFISKWSVKSYKNIEKGKWRKKVLITTPDTTWRIIVDPITKKSKKSDILFDSIITELKFQYEIVTTYPLGLPTSGLIFSLVSGLEVTMDKRKNQKDIVHKPFNLYWSWSIWRKERKAMRRFKKIWNELSAKEQFRALWKYEDINLYELIKDELSYHFVGVFPRVVKLIEMAKLMVGKEKPNLLLLENEYGIWQRSLVVAAKARGIPILALQHGIIHPFHPGYFHTKDEISDEIAPQYCPLPDKTAVYSPWVKKILSEVGNYPEDNIVVTGQPRYDILSRADEFFDREEFCKNYNLDSKKKIVILATQPFPVSEEREKFLRNTLRALKRFPGIEIVIKPHPGEGEEWHKKITKEENVNATVLPRDSNTNEALYACDLQITVSSTTATEAIILGKPVIIVNFFGRPSPIPWVESGSALGVYEVKELDNAIKNALYNKEVFKKLAEARTRFIHEQAYLQDGRATERVVNLIVEMIEGEYR